MTSRSSSTVCVPILVLSLALAVTAKAADPQDLPFKVLEGFRVQHLYSVAREQQGSWVALATDHQGRLIASDQKGSLYRVQLSRQDQVVVEQVDLPIGHAHGLLCAFDSLYAIVAEDVYDGPGLYRVRDSDGDDTFEEVKLLQPLQGTGEHGPHSVVLSPDGNSLLVIAGNKTLIPQPAMNHSRVPTNWGEDDLLPRLWGPIGSEAGTPAPGGWIAKTDPEGQRWELIAVGLRNGFDIAFNAHGELFTVDADAEFDLGTPWYQPTRVFHVIPGTDYGWRSGAGKRPPDYPDTLPPLVELGSGSPTGVVSGQGTSFPARYQHALFVGDWSRGRLLAVKTRPHGSTYTGVVEEIIQGTPLPITDLVVHADGNIYFTLGGRGVTSGLYRLSWEGGDRVQAGETVDVREEAANLREKRRQLVSLSNANPLAAVEAAWPLLNHDDRIIRHSARLVLEHTPSSHWSDRAMAEQNPSTKLTALLALARSDDETLLSPLIGALTEVAWEDLADHQRLLWLRTAELTLVRLVRNSLDEALRQQLLNCLEPKFPQGDHALDIQLCRLLVYLQSEKVPRAALQRIADAVTQQQRLSYAATLRHQKVGWTPKLRQQYFSLLADAMAWHGGLSLSKYVERMGDDALARVPESQRNEYTRMLKSDPVDQARITTRKHVRDWTLDELLAKSTKLADGSPADGRQLYAELSCFACHRFRGEGGGVGPDLTTVARRLSTRDLLEAIVAPSKVISDQFAASAILTADSEVLTGRVVNLVGDTLLVQTDMLRPSQLQRIKRDDVVEIRPAQVSMMPSGLLSTCSIEDIANLLAFLKDDGPANDRIPTSGPVDAGLDEGDF